MGTYQAVRVLGARAAGSTLLMAAVGGQRALASGTAAGTDSSRHYQAKGRMRAGRQPGHWALITLTSWGDALTHGRHLRPRNPNPPLSPLFYPALCPQILGLRLTALTILGTFSPAVRGFTSWRTGLAWGENRKTVRETETRKQNAQ